MPQYNASIKYVSLINKQKILLASHTECTNCSTINLGSLVVLNYYVYDMKVFFAWHFKIFSKAASVILDGEKQLKISVNTLDIFKFKKLSQCSEEKSELLQCSKSA